MYNTVPDLPNQLILNKLLLPPSERAPLLNKYLPTLQSAFSSPNPSQKSQKHTSYLPEPFDDLFPNLHRYRFNYHPEFHSASNMFYNVHGFKPSIGVYCADAYFGGSCLPDITFNADKILSQALCPYGLPECRPISLETKLPINFDPVSEVYILNVSFSYELKLNHFPSFSQARIYYPSNCNYFDYENNPNYTHPPTEWYTSEKITYNYTLTQPQWEGIKRRYNLSNITYHYALVFKAKPLLFNQVIQYYLTQTDTSLFDNSMHPLKSINAVYPAIKTFFTAYHREEVLDYIYTKQLPLNRFFAKKEEFVKPGTLVYTSYNSFGILVEGYSIYLDPHIMPYLRPDFTLYSKMKYLQHINNYLSGHIIFPTSTLTPELSRIRNHLIKHYNDYIYTFLKNRKKHW